MRSNLRDHPKLMNWPPATGGAYGRGEGFPLPSEGTIHSVKLCEKTRILPTHLEIVKEFQGRLSSGLVFPADPGDDQVIRTLFHELQKLTGQLIEAISDLEFDL